MVGVGCIPPRCYPPCEEVVAQRGWQQCLSPLALAGGCPRTVRQQAAEGLQVPCMPGVRYDKAWAILQVPCMRYDKARAILQVPCMRYDKAWAILQVPCMPGVRYNKAWAIHLVDGRFDEINSAVCSHPCAVLVACACPDAHALPASSSCSLYLVSHVLAGVISLPALSSTSSRALQMHGAGE